VFNIILHTPGSIGNQAKEGQKGGFSPGPATALASSSRPSEMLASLPLSLHESLYKGTHPDGISAKYRTTSGETKWNKRPRDKHTFPLFLRLCLALLGAHFVLLPLGLCSFCDHGHFIHPDKSGLAPMQRISGGVVVRPRSHTNPYRRRLSSSSMRISLVLRRICSLSGGSI
jgi:hypothetical protein